MDSATLDTGDLPAGFSMASPGFIRCPFPDYEWMLEERPVWRDPATGFLIVTRYEDVRAIAMDPETWSSRTSLIFTRQSPVADQVRAMFEQDGWLEMDTLVTNDPPEHKRYRALVERALSPARVKAIQPIIDAAVERLTARILDDGETEFMQRFAIPLTMTMLSSQITGAEPEDYDRIRHWTELLMEQISPHLTPERELEITPEVIKFQQFVACAIERFRAEPNETILSDLVHARIDGEGLSVREIIAVATQFFGAGHDTTTSALGSALRHLAENPETLALLKRAPDKIPNFVEEILRLEAPIQRLFRRAMRDTSVAGVTVKEGEIAIIQWGGANRDPRRFACPAALDPDRRDASRHLTFGTGIHFCVGNQLARAELRSAIAGITRRCASIRLANGPASYSYHMQFIARSLARLDLVVEPEKDA
jgi:cytochrome P450